MSRRQTVERELAQVYHGLGVTSLTFSPDGRSLLIADMDATGDHLYVVSLVTYETCLLQAPDLPLNWRWLQPSWKP